MARWDQGLGRRKFQNQVLWVDMKLTMGQGPDAAGRGATAFPQTHMRAERELFVDQRTEKSGLCWGSMLPGEGDTASLGGHA